MQRNRRKQQKGKDQRSLQEKWKYKRNISSKYGHNKGQKWPRPSIEAEEIKKRWQDYTELYKKGLKDPDNHDGVLTH